MEIKPQKEGILYKAEDGCRYQRMHGSTTNLDHYEMNNVEDSCVDKEDTRPEAMRKVETGPDAVQNVNLQEEGPQGEDMRLDATRNIVLIETPKHSPRGGRDIQYTRTRRNRKGEQRPGDKVGCSRSHKGRDIKNRHKTGTEH